MGFGLFFWPFFFNCAGCMNGIIFTIGSFEQFTLCAKPVKFLPFFPVSYYFFFFLKLINLIPAYGVRLMGWHKSICHQCNPFIGVRLMAFCCFKNNIGIHVTCDIILDLENVCNKFPCLPHGSLYPCSFFSACDWKHL